MLLWYEYFWLLTWHNQKSFVFTYVNANSFCIIIHFNNKYTNVYERIFDSRFQNDVNEYGHIYTIHDFNKLSLALNYLNFNIIAFDLLIVLMI